MRAVRISTVAVAWTTGLACGAAGAILLGPFAPGWGMILGVPTATLVFVTGLVREPRDVALPWALRALLAITTGFVAAAIPLSLPIASDQAGLLAGWLGTASMVPMGVAALTRRARRNAARPVLE